MIDKKIPLKDMVIAIVYPLVVVVSIWFCRMVTILEGVDTIGIDIGELYNDILPYNISIYNFQEHSPWAAIPLIAPIILWLIATSCLQNRRTKELLVLALLIVTLVSYNAAINSAWEFLKDHCHASSLRGRYTLGIIYPTVYSALSVFALICEAYGSDEREV